MSNQSGAKTLESMSQAVWYNQWTLKKFAAYLKEDILEVGCGTGNFTKKLIDFGRVTAVDIDRKHIKQTTDLLRGKAKVEWGDIEKGTLGQKEFDSIVCLNVLEHINDDVKALMNIYNVLKINGYLILLVPAHQSLFGEIDKSIGHFRRYDKTMLIDILKKVGFKIEKARELNMLGAIGWFITAKIFSEKLIDEKKIKIFNFIAPFVLPLEDLIEPPIGTSILVIAKK